MSSQLSPRLPSSKKWTDLPADFTAAVRTIFSKQFKREAKLGEFLIQGRIFPQEVVIRAGYLEKGRLKQINFEASIDLPDSSGLSPELLPELLGSKNLGLNNTNLNQSSNLDDADPQSENQTMQKIYVCIDALGSVMEEFFALGEEGEIDVPVHWRPFDFEDETVYLQHSTINTRLEEEADRLLALHADFCDESIDTMGIRQLVQSVPDHGLDAPASTDALANAEVDSELAFEIQKAIRAGTYRTSEMEPDPSTLN
jgi:hypothetical protein